jgi:hypothetical protein
MKWREWFIDHWRAVQALAVLLALALTVLVTVRIVRPSGGVQAKRTTEEDPLASYFEASPPRARVWDIMNGPDSSTLALQTKCVNGNVSYIFAIVPTPTFIAHIGRTYGEAPLFQLALLDSAEFKVANIPITESQLVTLKDSTGKTSSYLARDTIALTCDQYSSLHSWAPTWRLSR